MKKLINISLTILALVFLSQSLSFAAQPPDNYLNSNLRSVYHGMGDGGTQLLNLTVREFVEMGLKKGSWEKASDIQWNYRMKIKDNVTGKVSNIVFAFSKNEKYFKDDVILFRIVDGNRDYDSRNIFATAFRIDNNVYPMTERGKKRAILEAKKKEEERIQMQKEEEQRKKDIELAAANEKRKLEEKEKERNEELASLHKQKLIDIQGHYENREGRNYEKKNGEIDVKVESQGRIIFSVVTAGSRTCRIENKSAELNHADNYSVSEAEFNDGNCRLMLTFRKAKMGSERIEMDVVEIDQRGKCNYCEKGAYIGGRFLKMGNSTEREKEEAEPINAEKNDIGGLIKQGLNVGESLFKLKK